MILHKLEYKGYEIKLMKCEIGFHFTILKNKKPIDYSYYYTNSLAKSIENAKDRIDANEIMLEIRK